MNITLRPTGLSGLLTDRLLPEMIFDRDLFDAESFFPVRLGRNVPSVNIKETPKEYMLEVAAPGLTRKDFSIEVTNHILKISAEKEEKKEEEGNGYSRKEYAYNSFCRSFVLPEDVKEGAIDARYENGILMVHIPKTKETQSKPVNKIEVT